MEVSFWSWMLLTRFVGVVEWRDFFRIVTGRVSTVFSSFSDTEKFGYIYLLHFSKDDAFVFGRNFSSHSTHLFFHDDSSQYQQHLG